MTVKNANLDDFEAIVQERDRYRNALEHIAQEADTVVPKIRAKAALKDQSIAVTLAEEVSHLVRDRELTFSPSGRFAHDRGWWHFDHLFCLLGFHEWEGGSAFGKLGIGPCRKCGRVDTP